MCCVLFVGSGHSLSAPDQSWATAAPGRELWGGGEWTRPTLREETAQATLSRCLVCCPGDHLHHPEKTLVDLPSMAKSIS